MSQLTPFRRAGVRTTSLRCATAVALVTAMVGGCGSSGVRARGANVVLFSIDTWRADHLSLYGYWRPTTPALERLARDAMVFDQAFSAASSTAPSHMSMLTGVPPLVHGVMSAGDTVRVVPAGIRTLAEMLKARGYVTGAFTAAGQVSSAFGFARGFDHFVQDGDGGMNGNGRYSMDASQVVAWLAEARARPTPFFLFLHTYIPHSPYLPPPPYDTRYDPEYTGAIPSNRDAFFRQLRAGEDPQFAAFFNHVDLKSPTDVRHLVALYDGECNAADDAVVAILRALDDAGVAERTVVVLTSDHGEEFTEHGSILHGGRLWDEVIHVPLVVRTPRTHGRGRRISTLASGLDIVPTILDLIGVPVDGASVGRSLVPLMQGDTAWPERAVLSENVLAATPGTATFEATAYLRSLRTAHNKLIRHVGPEPGDTLYDLDADPHETRNILDDPVAAPVVAQLRAASDAADRAEGALRAPAGERALSDDVLRELRALGYVQ